MKQKKHPQYFSTEPILAGSGGVPSEKSGFNLDRESEELTSGDNDDVWE